MNRNAQVVTFACNFALCIEAPPTVHSSFELHTSQDVKKVGSSTGTPATSTSPLGQTGRMPSAGKSTRKQVGMRHCGTEDLNRSKSIWWLSWDTHSSMISISSIFKLKLEIFAKKELLVQVPESSRWWTAGCHTQLWRQSVPIQAWILCLYESMSINIFRYRLLW